MRVVAVDWSGAATAAGQRARIWTAVAQDGELVSLTDGRTRHETIDHLIALASRHPLLVVGLDFAFSMPAWFLQHHALSGAPALWELAAADGERWLSECRPPFWGRPGTTRPFLQSHFRRSEVACEPVAGIRPKSVFQIGGAGAVGTGSIRGMPYLGALCEAGFSVWPFHPPSFPLVVEIYPRLLTGAVVKRRATDRRRVLETSGLDPRLASVAEDSEDAFDAAMSALTMSRCTGEFAALHRATDPRALLEGEIWVP